MSTKLSELDGRQLTHADVDKMYLAGKERSRNKGFKSSHLKASCRAAYQIAVAAMGDGPGGPSDKAEAQTAESESKAEKK